MSYMDSSAPRTLPDIEEHTRAFWTGGRNNELLINQCQDCGNFIHPPVPMCPKCHSRRVMATPTTGNAIVASFTINYTPWVPDLEVPYVFAVVELIEQSGLYVSTQLVNTDIQLVTIGMRVRACFECLDDVYLPLFEPA